MLKTAKYFVSFVFALLICAIAPAESATINVTANAPDVLGADGSCSLREAITNINNGIDTYGDCTATGTYGTNDTINLPAGTYTNTIATTNEDLNANGDLDILASVTITGAGAGSTIIDGGAIDRVLHVDPTAAGGVVVNIAGVTVQNGTSGGIYSRGTLTVDSSTISNNTALYGGGIENYNGTLTVTNSTISGNTATINGGGIFSYGTLTVTNSTISGNTATYSGGGIYNDGTLTVDSSTISNNTSSSSGGGIYSRGTLTVDSSTISGNTATYSGGGIHSYMGSLTVTNSTISTNTANNGGGVLNNGGTLTITNTTITGNSATTNGGGIYSWSGIINVSGSSVDTNTVNDCSGAITDNGGNYDSDGTCGFGPTQISPTGAITTTTPTYTWNAVTGATDYQLWVSDAATGGVINVLVPAAGACTAGVCSYTSTTALAYGNAKWWIRGYNSTDGYGVWLPAMAFTVHYGAAPAAPTLISPTGAITTTTPAYTWNAVPGATWYQVWVSDATTGGVIRTWMLATAVGCGGGTGTCSYTSTTALAYGNANWWVRGYNSADGYGAWSAPMPFSVQLGTAPAAPTLISPTGAIATTTPTYTWNAVTGATWYLVRVDDSSGATVINNWMLATAVGCAGGVGTCSYTSVTAVATGAAKWWARGYNSADGYGAWGGPMTFTAP